MRKLLWTSISLTALIAGCSGFGPTSSDNAAQPSAKAPQPIQRCNLAPAQWAVGKTNTIQHVEEARRRSGALMARVLRPGQAVTQEFNQERLSLQVDATGRVLKATCG